MPRRGGEETGERIRKGAIRLFAGRGYMATSVRDLALEAGVKVGSLYNHFPAKEEILFSIMSGVMRDLAEAAEMAAAGQKTEADELRAVIETSTLFYGRRGEEVFIGTSELRSLHGPRRAAVVGLRDRYEELVSAIIRRGVEKQVFFLSDIQLTGYAVVGLGLHIPSWYSPGGRLSLEEIASIQADFVLRSLTNPRRQVALGDVLRH